MEQPQNPVMESYKEPLVCEKTLDFIPCGGARGGFHCTVLLSHLPMGRSIWKDPENLLDVEWETRDRGILGLNIHLPIEETH